MSYFSILLLVQNLFPAQKGNTLVYMCDAQQEWSDEN